jgi:hypothetical protein
MSSDAPRSVKLARRLVGTLALVPLSTLLIWIYAHEIKPYEVRYYAHATPNDPAKFQVEIYSHVDGTDSALVSLDCHPDNLVDVTFRPVLQESRDWSLREMFPSVSEANTFLAGRNALRVDEIADRHLPGGLSEWEGLERIQLQNRLDLALGKTKGKLTSSERTQLEQQFISLSSPHQTKLLPVPLRISPADQIALRDAVDRTQQAWEKSVAIINSNWLLRWQALTGTALAVPIKGVGAATPLYLSIPPLKQGAAAVLGIERESPVVPQSVSVVVGDTTVYRVQSRDQLKSPSILLLVEDDWWLVPVLLAVIAICGLVYYSYWRWPKHLEIPELFREAQRRNSDELWGELRARTVWLESYVMSSFFAARTGMLPNADVISYFWRLVRDTLTAHPVPATDDSEVRQAILDVLDRSIQNALT